MQKYFFRISVFGATIAASFLGASVAIAHGANEATREVPPTLYSHEISALLHGFLGLVLIIGLAAVFGGLWQMNEKGFRWIKVGVIALAVSSILLWASGTYLYSIYRGADGVKSIILESSRPWVHEVMMELKEFTGAYVAIMLVVMWGLVQAYGAKIVTDNRAKMMFVTLLVAAVSLTVLTFGLGAFITKTAPL